VATQRKTSPGTIALNKKAKFNYHLHEKFEAGIVLLGWEVKSLRAGKCQLTDTFILLRNSEAFLLACNISPLQSASSHVIAEPQRTRKLLLHRKQIAKLIGATQQKGYTCIPVAIYWKDNKVKVEIALASGKKEHDKRITIKEREWKRDQQRAVKMHNR
jgi:SsrA-binding protein